MENIIESIIVAGGTPVKVGGCVRDKLLGVECKDIDVEVFGIETRDLISILSRFGKVSVVGESFGVIKLSTSDAEFDFSLPRRDNKIGQGHKGFNIVVDHTMTPEQAAARRDFTINTIYENFNGELVDPFNGKTDLENRILRATSHHFSEDPLRVLRGFQFVSRFNLSVDPATLEMCRTLKGEFETLPKERVWEEWKKWALKANKPSLGLRFLVDCDWVSHFPELEHLIGVPQDPEWHPEGQDDPLGSAFIHTLHVTDAAAVIADRENLQDEDRVTIILAALCHDLGKAFPKHGGTTEFLDGRWRANAHAEAGVPLSRDFLKRIGCLDRIIDRILPLVAEHMVCTNSLKDIGPRMVRRLCSRLGAATLRELMMIFEADHSGRPPIPAGLGDGAKKIWEIAETLSLKEKKPVGIIGGKHLLAKGLKPGSQFGLIIKQCFEAQLDGVFADEAGAVAHLEEILKCH